MIAGVQVQSQTLSKEVELDLFGGGWCPGGNVNEVSPPPPPAAAGSSDHPIRRVRVPPLPRTLHRGAPCGSRPGPPHWYAELLRRSRPWLNAVLDRITVKNGGLYIVQRAIDWGMEHDFVLAVKHRLTSDYALMSLYILSGHFHEESFPGNVIMMMSTRRIHNAGKGVHSLPIKVTTSEIQ